MQIMLKRKFQQIWHRIYNLCYIYIKYIQKKEKHKIKMKVRATRLECKDFQQNTNMKQKYINISINKYRKIYLLKVIPFIRNNCVVRKLL